MRIYVTAFRFCFFLVRGVVPTPTSFPHLWSNPPSLNLYFTVIIPHSLFLLLLLWLKPIFIPPPNLLDWKWFQRKEMKIRKYWQSFLYFNFFRNTFNSRSLSFLSFSLISFFRPYFLLLLLFFRQKSLILSFLSFFLSFCFFCFFSFLSFFFFFLISSFRPLMLYGLRNRSKRVRTPVALLRSLSGKYPWERYEPSYPPSNGLNSTTTVLLGEWLCH